MSFAATDELTAASAYAGLFFSELGLNPLSKGSFEPIG
jgi:hypothetical protein